MNDAEKIEQEIKQDLEVDEKISSQIPRNTFRDAFNLEGQEAVKRKARELAQIHGWKVLIGNEKIWFSLTDF